MAEHEATATTAQTANDRGTVSGALNSIDQARWMLALIDDITDHTEEIHLEGDAVIGFKQAMLNARTELQNARAKLEQIAYSVPRLDRTRARAV